MSVWSPPQVEAPGNRRWRPPRARDGWPSLAWKRRGANGEGNRQGRGGFRWLARLPSSPPLGRQTGGTHRRNTESGARRGSLGACPTFGTGESVWRRARVGCRRRNGSFRGGMARSRWQSLLCSSSHDLCATFGRLDRCRHSRRRSALRLLAGQHQPGAGGALQHPGRGRPTPRALKRAGPLPPKLTLPGPHSSTRRSSPRRSPGHRSVEIGARPIDRWGPDMASEVKDLPQRMAIVRARVGAEGRRPAVAEHHLAAGKCNR